jgi:dihydroorotate dehydrogenase
MYQHLRPLLFRLDAERAHGVATVAARLAQVFVPSRVASSFMYEHDALRQTIWGIDLLNPVGLAAGFDKNAKLIPFWALLGFGFVEVGSVSARPSRGNPRPRAFRLTDDAALVNRMGLNNEGAAAVAERIRRSPVPGSLPLGINLAKTHDPSITGDAAVEDFRESFRQLAPLARYVALNVSCPNTAEGKTFEEPRALDDLLAAVFAERAALGSDVPVLVKLSPPPSERVVFDSLIEELLAVALRHGVHGFIAGNTAPDRDGLSTPPERVEQIGRGGLSGRPIARRATRLVEYLYRKTGGATPIIGVGGVASADDAYDKIRAGASLVQLYTGLVYEGPGLVKSIKLGLVRLLERDGFETVRNAVGASIVRA